MKTIHINLAGKAFVLNIESLRGRYRIKDGKARRYAADYGEIADTKGADGDPVDVYWGGLPDVGETFVINQYRADGSFDEHKVMLGFFDREQAARAYQISTGVKPDIYACTPAQLAWWLAHGNLKKPVTQQSFPFDAEQETMPHTDIWTDNLPSSAAKLLYGWRKTDTGEELLEAATMDALLQTEVENGAQIDEAVFDALAVPSKKLERTAQIVGVSLNRAAESLKVAEDGIHISKPMKQNGTTNVVVMFEITDGQTVSVFFHNPDTTPQKLAPDDVLVSWKWLLNRKDITIAVAKENGRDLQIQQVARRVMALVEKNTARFAKANAARAERIVNLQKMEAEIAEKEALVEELSAQLEVKTAGMVAGNPDSAPTETPAPTGGSLNTEPLDESSLQPLNVPENATAKEVRKALESYLKQLQGKTVITSDGKTVRFSGKSTSHLANDVLLRKNSLIPLAVAKVVEVLKTGEFVGRQENYKERQDGFVAFHAYQKWVEAGNMEMLLQIKAGELDSGILEAGDGLLAYSAKNADKAAMDSSLIGNGSSKDDHPAGVRSVSSTAGAQSLKENGNHNATYDSAQDEPYIFLEILEVRDKQKAGEEPEQADAEMLVDWLMERGYEKQADSSFSKRFSDRTVFVIAAKVRANIMVSTHLSGTPVQQDFHDKLVALPSTGQKESFVTYQDFAAIKRLVEEAETVAVDVSSDGESAEYSTDNPYAAYAGDDEEARQNADDWEARIPLTEAVLVQLNEKAEQQGFTTLVETRHASLGRFQAVKKNGQRQALIDGEFKNHGSSSIYEAPRDFTVTLKDADNMADYFYTNDIDAALEKAGDWLAAAEEMPEPVQVSGKELGDFDTATEDGKKALREAAFDELLRLAKSGETVFCRALNADVRFSVGSTNKFKRFSGDLRKVQIAAQIRQIIANGVKFKESMNSYADGEAQNKTVYHYLKTPVSLEGVQLGARVVIREDNMGNFYWDLRVIDDVEAIMDSTTPQDLTVVAHRLTNATARHRQDAENPHEHYSTAAFDDASSGYVLNLFLFDADGKEITDDAETTPESNSQADAAKQSDNAARAYLQAIISGKTDVLADGFDDEFLAFVEQHEQDEALRELLEQAVAVWQQAALNASENIK